MACSVSSNLKPFPEKPLLLLLMTFPSCGKRQTHRGHPHGDQRGPAPDTKRPGQNMKPAHSFSSSGGTGEQDSSRALMMSPE
ncbi:hypothetical protein EYF80_050385 [Liparis tanakae]|uniref:Uncharacterized protein n=1 Tax=Liparis tanakae TaxID=230148 RepID=A0A4Z2FEX7_9TELE|nr:hypothetical protein EYF80_050385 [Liparis tanakae]